MNVEAMNAVTRDRARIREGIGGVRTITIHGHEAGHSQPYSDAVWVKRSDVLALLTDNVVLPRKVPVHCGCCLGSAEHIAAVTDKPGEKIPQSEWNLERFIIDPPILHAHDAGADKPILRNDSIGYVPAKKQLVILDFCDGKVYVYPYPELVVHSDVEDWIADETEHNVGSCEWMITSAPFEIKT